ncbi:MAG: GNAT family N-acetyltransferase [Oscillospiraceae bacterium]|nr:GNAT family N-acetyltransferase [Oscillospiraceae bacterium]
MFVREIKSEEMKRELTVKIMGSLPEWFNPPEDIPKKAELHSSMTFFAVCDDVPIGFAALKVHNPHTAEIFDIGVLRDHHRRGAGHMLIKACEERCRDDRRSVLTVKTLDGSADYPPYEATRAFYLREGFVPLEVFEEYWGRDNPCLFLAKWLSR